MFSRGYAYSKAGFECLTDHRLSVQHLQLTPKDDRISSLVALPPRRSSLDVESDPHYVRS